MESVEQHRQRSRAYYHLHRAAAMAVQAAYREANREHLRERALEYYYENKAWILFRLRKAYSKRCASKSGRAV